MSDISPLLLLTLGELLLVTSILSGVMIVLAVVKKRRDRASAQKLISRIKQDENRRQSETRKLMGSNFGLEGEILTTLVKKISREEKYFYQTLINLYLKRDAGALEVLHVAFEGATEPYRSLQLPKPEPVAEQKTADTGESEEIARLRDENARLSEELRITMDTMGRMLSEYSSMYAGGADSELDKEKILNMFRAQAEENAQQDAAAEAPAAKQATDTDADQPAVEESDTEAVVNSAETAEQAAMEAAAEPANQTTEEVGDESLDDLDEALLSLDDTQFEAQGEVSEPTEKQAS